MEPVEAPALLPVPPARGDRRRPGSEWLSWPEAWHQLRAGGGRRGGVGCPGRKGAQRSQAAGTPCFHPPFPPHVGHSSPRPGRWSFSLSGRLSVAGWLGRPSRALSLRGPFLLIPFASVTALFTVSLSLYLSWLFPALCPCSQRPLPGDLRLAPGASRPTGDQGPTPGLGPSQLRAWTLLRTLVVTDGCPGHAPSLRQGASAPWFPEPPAPHSHPGCPRTGSGTDPKLGLCRPASPSAPIISPGGRWWGHRHFYK